MQYSIILYSNVIKDSDSFRLDADFFQTQTLLDQVRKYNILPLKKTSRWITQGPNPIFSDNGLPCLTGRNIAGGYLNFEGSDLVDEREYLSLSRFILFKNDILITLKGAGSTGKVALYNSDKEAIFSRNLGLIRIDEKSQLTPEFVFTFLATSIGQKIIDRGVTGGTGQLTLPTTYLKNLEIPIFSTDLIKSITECIRKHLLLNEQSTIKYLESQNILLSELGLIDWKPEHKLSFSRNYSETQQAERIDAEYFQPKYKEIITKIKNYVGGWDILGNLVTLKKCVEVGSKEYSDEGIPFIRVSNLSPFEITEEKYISEKLYCELAPNEDPGISLLKSNSYQPKKGEILFSKDATPGIAFFINEEPQKMIPSGGIMRLKIKNKRVNPSYLTLVLNSLIVKEQINRDVGGSVILHWRPDQIKQTLIPILNNTKQEQIEQKIAESFYLRKESKHLIECAKKAVEIAIENDENSAIKWLKTQNIFV